MVVFGGVVCESSSFTDTRFLCVNAVDEFSFQTSEWFKNDKLMKPGSSPSERFFHSCISVNDKMYVFGGIGKKKLGYEPLNDLWLLDSSKKWTQLNTNNVPKCLGAKMFFNENFLYIIGGNDGVKTLNTVNIYDTEHSVMYGGVPMSNAFFFDTQDDESISSMFGGIIFDKGQMYMFG